MEKESIGEEGWMASGKDAQGRAQSVAILAQVSQPFVGSTLFAGGVRARGCSHSSIASGDKVVSRALFGLALLGTLRPFRYLACLRLRT